MARLTVIEGGRSGDGPLTPAERCNPVLDRVASAIWRADDWDPSYGEFSEAVARAMTDAHSAQAVRKTRAIARAALAALRPENDADADIDVAVARWSGSETQTSEAAR